jgi:hypothetical protein
MLGFACTDLITGAGVVRPAAATAGAATTETASRAAEIVLNMVVSFLARDHEVAGRMAGFVDHGCDLRGRALNPP